MTDTESRERPLDRVASWLLFAVTVVACLGLAALAITAVFVTDSCGSTGAFRAVCDGDYFAGVLVAYWVALAVIPLMAFIAIVRAIRRGTRSWTWALGLLVLTVPVTALFVALMSR